MPVACSVDLAGNWLFVDCQGTSMCRAPSRQRPVGSTRQIHQVRCWLVSDLGAAQTGWMKYRALFSGDVAFGVIAGLTRNLA